MKKTNRNIQTGIILLAILFVTKHISVMPWWFFIIPVLVTGIITALKKWKVNTLSVGFLSGLLMWTGANLYYNFSSEALLLSRFGWPAGLITLLASGLVGGVLTALALYTGKTIISNKKRELTL